MRSSPAEASRARVSGFNSVMSFICLSPAGGGLRAAAGDAGGAALLLSAFLLKSSHTFVIEFVYPSPVGREALQRTFSGTIIVDFHKTSIARSRHFYKKS